MIHFSGRLATMLGYHPNELEGAMSEWDKMVYPEGTDGMTRVFLGLFLTLLLSDLPRAQALRRAHLAGEISHYEIEKQVRTKSGEWRWILNRGKVVVRDPQGNPIKMVGSHTDITDRRKAEIALEEKNRQLDIALHQAAAAAQSKSEFLANISHEVCKLHMNGKRNIVLQSFLLLRFGRHLMASLASAVSWPILIWTMIKKICLAPFRSVRMDFCSLSTMWYVFDTVLHFFPEHC